MNTLMVYVSERISRFWLESSVLYRGIIIGIVALWFLGFLVAAFAPTTVLTDHWILQKYVSAMNVLVNPRGLMGTRSAFPEVTALYHAIVFWSLPLWFHVWLQWMVGQVGVSKTGLLFKARLSIWHRLGILLLLPIFAFIAYGGFNLNHGGDTRLVAFGTSRMQLATFGIGLQVGAAFAAAAVLFSLKRIFTFNTPEEKK